MSDEEKRDFRASRNEIQFELEPCGLSWPDDFDRNIIANHCDKFIEREDLQDRSIEDILAIRHLGEIKRSQFFPNKALALLAGRNVRALIPGCRVRIQRFEGIVEGQGSTYSPSIDRFVEGNVVTLIERSSSILDNIIRDFTYLGKDSKFVTTKEYPRTAWFEALVNAVVHRSYILSGTDITVKLFEDRMVIESPGGFCPPVTPENIYEVRASRNPFLMDAMYLLDFVKAAREGTRRMRASMKEYGLPEPTFVQEAVHGLLVRVELKNNAEYRRKAGAADVVEYYGHSLWTKLTEDERKAAEIALRNGAINVSETQRATSRSWQTSKRILIRMAKRGMLTHVHDDSERDTKAFFVPRKPNEQE
ncbi:MAG: ATP-binding protein [Parvularcula sp.]|jgi:ATP-dependent DNA helicase RecG|nr:ATP-binding protein [Parvularcula sp.]